LIKHCRTLFPIDPVASRLARVLWILACGSIFWLTAASGLAARTHEELISWAEGPVQWLLLPEERKELRRIDRSTEAEAFIEGFWSRRDPDSLDLGNTFWEAFEQRVEAADVLYADEGDRGSLTDRGRALILLGPPTHVTVSTEPVMAWDPASDSEDRVTMRHADIEFWGYRIEDLPAGTLQLWQQKKKKAADGALALTLMFRKVGRRTSLVEGEALLEVAARAVVQNADSD